MSDGAPPAEVRLDVRELPPCEPFELALAAARALAPGQRLRVIHWREPFPLYAVLEREGFRYEVEHLDERLEITIWRPSETRASPR